MRARDPVKGLVLADDMALEGADDVRPPLGRGRGPGRG